MAKYRFKILSFFDRALSDLMIFKNRQFKQSQHKINSLFFLKDSSGVAMLELLPFVVLILILVSLTFGLWASIHAGTLRSIAARHYAFEVINNRANFNCHRDTLACKEDIDYYKKLEYRFFAVVKDQSSVKNPEQKVEPGLLHLFKGFEKSFRKKLPSSCPNSNCVNPISLKQGYGICITCNCGGKGSSC